MAHGRDSAVTAAPQPRAAATGGNDSNDSSRANGDATTSPLATPAPRRLVLAGVDFTGVGHDRGRPSASVVLVELSDFGCPYCGEFALETLPALDWEYVQSGKVLFKYVPFIAGTFRHSREATRAAECAAEQGRFWTMSDRIFETQSEWRRGNAADAQMAALAGTTGADSARFAACYASGRTEARTARATDLADQLGVRITPSFLVNDRPVQGALPLAEFRKVIDAALLAATVER
jgi:protein-disulfide isomerase